jgi:hypothetical protein
MYSLIIWKTTHSIIVTTNKSGQYILMYVLMNSKLHNTELPLVFAQNEKKYSSQNVLAYYYLLPHMYLCRLQS